MQNQLKSLALILYKFSTQSGKTRKKFINISRILNQQKASQSSQTLNAPPIKKVNTKQSLKTDLENEPSTMDKLFTNDFQPNPSEPYQPGYSHMSPEQQKINNRIKTAIRSESIYHECAKNKHKLEPRHYAVMFSKILQLRRNVPKQRKQTEGFVNFLKIVEKNLEKMPPEELVRIVYAMKKEGARKQELKLFQPIIYKIINQFSNAQNTELDPKSFQTFKLHTSVNLFKSFAFLLKQTGSHFEQKLKQTMNETLNYILFQSMKTKKFSKQGEYFSPKLKMNFLGNCKQIDASAACVKNLILSVLVQRQRLQLQTLLDLQAAIFDFPEVAERTRHQLFIEKDIHIKFNIFYRIQNYIKEKIPKNLKKSSHYSLLTKKLVKHLSRIEQFTFDQLKIMEMNSSKDQQWFKVLTLFHQAYKNCLIENFTQISEKDDAMAFFAKSEHEEYALYELLNFFFIKLKNHGPNSVRPSIKKELKDFVVLLTKFFRKLNFLTQSVVIELLVLSNFSNLKPIMIDYLEIHTLLSDPKTFTKGGFFAKDKRLMTDKFFEMIQYETIFKQNCSVQYEVLMKSNIKNVLKLIFKSKQQLNVEKYAFYMASYCRNFNQSELQSFVDQNISIYMRLSWTNRAFTKNHVETIYKNQDYFLSNDFHKKSIEFENQTDIFGEIVAQKEHTEKDQNQKLLPTLQSNREVLKEFYGIQQKIRHKLRNLFRNFKFLLLFFENIKLILPKEVYTPIINEDLYKNLLQNFKTELECMKFERLLTKQNCSELLQISLFLKNLWNCADSGVQIRNESLMHKNQALKEKQDLKNNPVPNQRPKLDMKLQNQQQKQKSEELLEQEEESQQGEYTQEIEYLKGKDLIQSETLKNYWEKKQKSEFFLALKNKECLTQIKRITKDFSQLPKTLQKLQQKTQILNNLVHFYTGNNEGYKQTKVFNLASLDDSRIAMQNLNQILSIQVQNSENRAIHTFKVYTKQYPTLDHISETRHSTEAQKGQQKIFDKIYYVQSSKMRRNKKRLQQMSQANLTQATSVQQGTQGKDKTVQAKVELTPSQDLTKQSL